MGRKKSLLGAIFCSPLLCLGIGTVVAMKRLEIKKREIMYFVWYLLIGLVAGWLANLVVRGSGSGLLVNLIVGLVGGLLGGWLVSLFGWIPMGAMGTLLTSVLGAIVLLCIVAIVNRKSA